MKQLSSTWYLAALVPLALAFAPGCGDDDSSADDDGGSDDDDPDAVTPTVSPEVDGRITINEFMADNVLTLIDDSGVSSDWVELYNPTDEDIPLHGYALTDDLDAPGKATIDAGVEIGAGQHLLLWLDGLSARGDHVELTLPRSGGTLALARPDGTFIDRVDYGEQETDLSAAREPDGSDGWTIEWNASPDDANPDGAGAALGLEDLDAEPEAVPAAGDVSDRILGYDAIPQIALTISPADIQSLRDAPRTYVEGYVTFDGRTYGPIGVRLKGQNSFRTIDQKPSLRLNINMYDDDASLLGLKDITLNNMSGDFSMMHERLAYKVARDAGVPASRCNHARLSINGTSYGLYANVESMKKGLVRRWFASDEGSMFKATDVDFLPEFVASYIYKFGPDDRSRLTGMASAMGLASASAAITAAGAHADVDEFLRYWAAMAIVGQFDAFPYSDPGDDYYLYVDPATAKLSALPAGLDETFYSSSLDVLDITHSVFAAKCKASASCLQALADKVWAILAMTEDFGLEAERIRVKAQIAPFVAADTKKEYDDDTVAEYQNALHFFITERRGKLETMLPPPSP